MARAALTALFLAAGVAVAAQAGAVREAQRLRDAGEFSAAIQVLRSHLAQQPDDGEATRLLAQTLYWTRDVDGARGVYEAALARHPRDHRLHLDYARMLVEIGERTRARELLAPLRDVPDARAEACTLLGTLSYWEGDLTTAARRFTEALAVDPGQTDAARQLREIRLAASPWMRVAPRLWHDDQPLDWGSVEVEAGWFPAPLTPVKVRVEPRRYSFGGRTSTMWLAEGHVRHYAPHLRLDVELAAGVLRRTPGDEPLEWTGRGVAGVRLPHHVTIRGRLERVPYLYTTASVDESILVDVAALELHWADPRGWLAQAALQHQQYPDDNVIRTGYGWILAPVASRRDLEVQAGYAFGADDAEESRFVPSGSPSTIPPPGSSVDLAGRYRPYYTPERVVKHMAIGAITSRLSPRATLRLGGSVAVRATEDAPAFLPTPLGVERVFERRAFTPWDLRASVDVMARDGLTIGVGGEVGRTAFYQWTRAGLELTYRFTSGARHAPERR